MTTIEKLAAALRAIAIEHGTIHIDGTSNAGNRAGPASDAARAALAQYDAEQAAPVEPVTVAICVNGGCLADVKASQPVQYILIDCDNIDDDDDPPAEDSDAVWERVTAGFITATEAETP